MQERGPDPAIVVKRVDTGTPELDEITALAEAADYRVVGSLIQKRTEDPEYHLGAGKVTDLERLVNDTAATTVIFDNRLGPYQTYNLGTRLSDGVEVIDRFTLILRIFGLRAETQKAQLQVELAELRYELPKAQVKASLARRNEHPGFMGLGEYDETYEQDLKARISRIKDQLCQIEITDQQRRDQQRESGFNLVALAGYTNAGKSTLLQRLAADLTVGQNDNLHPDIDPTAETKDRLFTTLGTTTRRMDMNRRDVLVTDTVGFINDLPPWLIESFKSTLDSVYTADLVLLVVDITDPLEVIREKLVTCHDILYGRNEAPIVTVLNKIDRISPAVAAEKRDAVAALAPAPVSVSAREGTNLQALRDRIHEELPAREHERLVLPLSDGTMSLVSWVHDHAYVETESYDGEQVTLAFEARPAVVEKARAKASELTPAART